MLNETVMPGRLESLKVHAITLSERFLLLPGFFQLETHQIFDCEWQRDFYSGLLREFPLSPAPPERNPRHRPWGLLAPLPAAAARSQGWRLPQHAAAACRSGA
jgi:hypothetical protein